MSKPMILICDDEEGLRESINLILEEKYALSFAAGGAEALEMLTTKQPDLLLLDIKMPGMNGLETLQNIHDNYPGLKVLIVTGYQSTETAQEAVRLGAIDYITKPFERDGLLKKVEQYIG